MVDALDAMSEDGLKKTSADSAREESTIVRLGAASINPLFESMVRCRVVVFIEVCVVTMLVALGTFAVIVFITCAVELLDDAMIALLFVGGIGVTLGIAVDLFADVNANV